MNVTKMAPAPSRLFALLPPSEMEHLAATLRAVEAPPGALLFQEDDRGDHFYVIVAGKIEVVQALGMREERSLGVWGPGEFISEMNLRNIDGPRAATVRVVSHARLLEMTRDDFAALLHRQPKLAYEMIQVLSARLNASHDAAIYDLQEKNRELLEAYEALKAAQAQVIEKEKLEHELQVAHNIQMGLLPRRLPDLADFDFGALITPMRAVGGDFYDFIPLDDNRLAVAVGDVSGHGVPAALMMALTVTLLRAEACRDCSPREVLRSVNRQLLNLNSEGMFVTVLYGVLNYATGDFTYVRAGHEPPIFQAASGEPAALRLGRGQLLGSFDEPPLAEQTLRLTAGSTLLLYTDGVTEAVDAEAEMFGHERLKAAVGAYHQYPAQKVCDRILELVTAHSGGATPSDDITLVCLRAI